VRRVSLVVVSIAVLAALAPAPAGAQSSVWPSGNGVIVFRSDRDGDPDVFALDPSQGTATKLTSGSEVADVQPAWAPEGGRVLYVRRRVRLASGSDLFVMNAAGTARRRVTSTRVPERDPSWSPNGTRIVYAARTDPGGRFRLFVAKADGSGRAQLTTQTAGTADRAPAWSPDGSRIAFVSDRDGGFPELYVVDADGTGVRRLTNNSLIDGNPSWSSDGARLVFERCCKNGTSDLFTIDVATRAEVNLTASTTQQEFDPAWSPDGSRIAFVAFEVGQDNIDVWVMNADGSSQQRLTQEAGPDLSPDWQPLPLCTITGSDAVDDLIGTDGNDVICPLAGHDHVRAGEGDDLVLGAKGDDLLEGQGGADVLLGENGSDTLEGGSEYDLLDGGIGTDTCLPGGDGALRRLCEL
jgi:dipeptidyl aminopeptidase/acylaminoacyl peptidase